MYLTSAETDTECQKCGREIVAGNVMWRDFEKHWCPQCEPDWDSETAHRTILRRAKAQDIIKLCFAKGYSSGRGQRTKIYYAGKAKLIEMLLSGAAPDGRPVLTSERPKRPRGSRREEVSASASADAIDETTIRRIIDEALGARAQEQEEFITGVVVDELKKRKPTTIEVRQTARRKIRMGLQHYLFPRLLSYVGCRLNVYLVGPAGSGKTRAAREVAKALGLRFYAESVSQQTPVHKLMGYRDANGRYRGTAFRSAFEGGGIFLLDEMDAGNPNVLAAFNAAVAAEAGETISFPDKMVKKHKNFTCIGAANTYGRGGDREYVGRNPLDAATLDRFVTIEWDYDEALERAICEKSGYDSSWVDHVQACRKAAGELRVRLVISPRACFFGGRLLAAGQDWEEVEKAVMFKGLDAGSADKVRARARA